jgi:D-arabinose 1-dehydrogenase-like Zn-dependent alcohol dehydrogenase
VKPNTKVCLIGIGALGHLAVQFLVKKGRKSNYSNSKFNKKKKRQSEN